MTVQPKPFALEGALSMSVDGEKLGSANRLALLAKIAECGSITHAAKAMQMSYKAAWDAIEAMNHVAGEPLVARLTGGKGGGCTHLTARGAQLVARFQILAREHERFLQQLNAQAKGLSDDYQLIRKMAMKTSARNQFLGKVISVRRGVVNDEVELEIIGGARIVAVVTQESTQSLGLEPGAEAFALVKSSSVIVLTEDEGARFSARNRLAGTVTRLVPGAVNTEVLITLSAGGSIAAIITHESTQALSLVLGQPAAAIFKASSVILGVPA